MTPGSERWKWILVIILLVVFMITANQAYIHLTSQEDYPPPTDYLQGDSWDLEHSSGPGAGQAIQQDVSLKNSSATEIKSKTNIKKNLQHQSEIDWSKIRNPSIE